MTIIARAFIQPARSVSLRTWPGGRADFHSGVAHLNDERSVVCLLQRADVVIEPTERYIDFVPSWIKRLGEHKRFEARIELPEGYDLGPAPDYELIRPAPVLGPQPEGTRVFVDGVEASAPAPLPEKPPRPGGGKKQPRPQAASEAVDDAPAWEVPELTPYVPLEV